MGLRGRPKSRRLAAKKLELPGEIQSIRDALAWGEEQFTA
jgi:hypothetical protein